MPLMNGYEAVEMIREKEKELTSMVMTHDYTKIIAVTASIFDEQANNIKQFGFDDLIRKPITAQVILEQLKSHLKLQYIYDDEIKENQIFTVLNLDDLLQNQTLTVQVQKMPLNWRNQIIASANRGSDDELLNLISQIPADFVTLQEILSHLTHEFLFEEITNLIFNVNNSVT